MTGTNHLAEAEAPGQPSHTPVEARSPPGQWRLLAAALFAWALTSWAIIEPGRGAAVATVAGAVGSALLVWTGLARAFKRKKPARLSLAIISFLMLCSSAVVLIGTQVHLAETARAAPLLSEAASGRSQVTFTAELVGFPKVKPSPFGDRAWVRIEVATSLGSVPMLLWLPDSSKIPRHWGPGLRVQVTAKLKAQPPQDSAAYTATPKVLEEVASSQFKDSLNERVGATAAILRQTLVEHASEVPGAELVPGFAVGDTSLVPERLSDAMLESSLTHLTAVSGSNTGLVIAAIVWCVARLHAGRRLRTISAACGLAAFVLVVGPDASVQRAAIMATVLLLGAFGGRRSAAFPALGVAVLALLAFDPWQSLQPGFSLSVAATCGILLCAAPLTNWIRSKLHLPKVLALPLGIALAAQLFCAPLVLLLQPGVPAVGVLANVIAAPAAPIGTGVGLVATVLGPISPPLASFTVSIASLAGRWVAATAEVSAGLPGGRWHWPEGWPGALLLLGCQLAIVTAWALATGRIGLPGIARVEPRSPWQTKAAMPNAIRSASAALIGLSLATVFATTVLTPYASQLSAPHDWVIVACDVGQGDALLVRDPRQPNEVMLVDTGDDPKSLHACLSRFGVKQISLLVLTHDDRDHIGAVESVLDRVEAALISPPLQGEPSARRPIVHALNNAGVPFRVGAAGDGRSADSTGLDWQILAPLRTTVPTESNSASLVLLVEVQGHRILMLADTGYEEQHGLRATVELTDIDVVKVAHHGSRDQDKVLIASIAAAWGLISVGAGNGYGHPNDGTISAFARAGTRTLRTDEFGSIALVLQSDGALIPWVERTAVPAQAALPGVGTDD